jgi:hypothetical protein
MKKIMMTNINNKTFCDEKSEAESIMRQKLNCYRANTDYL